MVAEGIAANHIARWDGAHWSPLGTGLESPPGSYAGGNSLEVFDDGSGPALWAGGFFQSAGGIPASHIARWDGAAWSAAGSIAGFVYALRVYDDGTGPALFAGGHAGVLRWNGVAWAEVGGGVDDKVFALVVYDDGSGPALYAAGAFAEAGDVHTKYIARWDGHAWSDVGGGIKSIGWARALTVFDEGAGPALFVGGEFTDQGDWHGNRIARWDGAAWSWLGSGTGGRVDALAVHDDGNGAALYAAGPFESAGGAPASGIARWDGQSWSSLDGGLEPHDPFYLGPKALASYDEFGRSVLFVGGTFGWAGDQVALNLARWACPAASHCYVDCDTSSGQGVFDLFDFLCFQNLFVAGDQDADCDGSGDLDLFDFLCTINQFYSGCP